jgi:hypothetical protein
LGFVPNVEGAQLTVPAARHDSANGFFRCRMIAAVIHHDPRARLSEGQRNCSPNATTGAGNQGDLIVESH